MNSFHRVLRLALRNRATFAASVASALVVAVLWGGNITAVYPFVEVILNRRAPSDWIRAQIADAEGKVAAEQSVIAGLDQQLAGQSEQRDRLLDERETAEWQLDAESRALAWYRAAQPYVENYLPDDPFQVMLLVLGLLLVGTAVKGLFIVAHTILAAQLAQRATFDLRNNFYRRTLRMDVSSFSQDGTGELMSRFTYDMENVAEGLNTLFGKAVREPLKMLTCLVGAACVSWRLLVLSLVIVPVAAVLVDKLAKALKRANRRAMEEMSQIYALLEETFQGIKLVKAFTMERAERLRFHQGNKKFYHKAMRIMRYEAISRPSLEMMGMLVIFSALLAGAWLVLKNETHLLGIRMTDRPLSIGSLLLFYGLLAGTSDPARKLSEIFGRLQRAIAASERIYDMLDREPMIQDAPHAKPCPRHSRELIFDQVKFQYSPTVPLLDEIDLSIPFGETIAIVGPNGCGKTTLVNLLPRFFDPVAGRITLDGVDLRELKLRELRAQIGMVTQETLLFDDTIYNNIRYGAAWATRDQVIEAAKQAHAHRFIEERLEHGYETLAGPRGSSLSGGQRQRIALARAILRDPAILILDEATSQIDLESEQLIHKVLEKFTRNRTTFLITHRLSTLTLADRILVMNSGRILDLGRHEELMRRCDFYRRLHELQFKIGA